MRQHGRNYGARADRHYERRNVRGEPDSGTEDEGQDDDEDDNGDEDDRMSGVEFNGAPIEHWAHAQPAALMFPPPQPPPHPPADVDRDRQLVEDQVFANIRVPPAPPRDFGPFAQVDPQPVLPRFLRSPSTGHERAHDRDDDPVHMCPKCDRPLHDLDEPGREAHLRQCLDDGGGATLLECPICDENLDGLTERDKELHVDECCNGGAGGGGVGGTGTGSGARGDEAKTRSSLGRKQEYLEFQATNPTVPRDASTKEALEVSSYRDRAAGARLTGWGVPTSAKCATKSLKWARHSFACRAIAFITRTACSSVSRRRASLGKTTRD